MPASLPTRASAAPRRGRPGKHQRSGSPPDSFGVRQNVDGRYFAHAEQYGAATSYDVRSSLNDSALVALALEYACGSLKDTQRYASVSLTFEDAVRVNVPLWDRLSALPLTSRDQVR